jgi:hypothetical protein
MNASITSAVALMTLGLIAGCATAPAEPAVMKDAQANFGAYKTFAWYPQGNANRAQSIVDGYIRTAITNAMQAKGYVAAPEGAQADLLVEYDAASEQKLKEKPFRIGIGVGGYGSSGGASVGATSSGVKEVKEGTLVIHVVDPARNAEVWRGSVARELKAGTADPAIVNEAVADAFSDFPARTAPP